MTEREETKNRYFPPYCPVTFQQNWANSQNVKKVAQKDNFFTQDHLCENICHLVNFLTFSHRNCCLRTHIWVKLVSQFHYKNWTIVTITLFVGLSLTMVISIHNPEYEVLLRNSINKLKTNIKSFINKDDIFFNMAPRKIVVVPEKTINDDTTIKLITTTSKYNLSWDYLIFFQQFSKLQHDSIRGAVEGKTSKTLFSPWFWENGSSSDSMLCYDGLDWF